MGKTFSKKQKDFLLNMIESEKIKLESIKETVKNKDLVEEPLSTINELSQMLNKSNGYIL